MKRAERITAGILICIAIYFQIRMEKFDQLSKLFPQVIIIILGGLAILLFVLSFVKTQEAVVFERASSYIIPILSAAVMIIWVGLIRVIGFLFSSIIFFPLMIVVISSRKAKGINLLKNCLIAFGLIGVFFLVFTLLLNVQFPAGLLGII